MRILSVEQILVDASNEECEMNPAAFIIVSFWLVFMVLTIIISFSNKNKRQDLHRIEDLKEMPYVYEMKGLLSYLNMSS
jgi:hypothetical protein